MALLEIHELEVRFGGVVAVAGASFAAEQGTITGLIGPNGAGKTTCFNVISGLQRPTAGTVRFGDRDITRTAVHRRARLGIGRTFQRLEAFGSLTVHDNVRAALDIHRGLRGSWRGEHHHEVELLLDQVGIRAYAGERADSIPTGTARLLDLARCLASDPALLLLDEPSSGLDETETDEFGRLLLQLASSGRSILMVEHDMDLVMSTCDRIHVLDFGKVIASGSPSEVRTNIAVQEAYLGSREPGELGGHAQSAAEALPA